MEINIKINAAGRHLTIDNHTIKLLDGKAIEVDAGIIESYSPCELLYFSPIIVNFNNTYCSSNKLIYLNDQFNTSFSWQGCDTVLAYISMPTPNVYINSELDYQLTLRTMIDSDNRIEIRDFNTFHPATYPVALNNFGMIIRGGSYKKVFSELNKKVGQLHHSTVKSLGWK